MVCSNPIKAFHFKLANGESFIRFSVTKKNKHTDPYDNSVYYSTDSLSFDSPILSCVSLDLPCGKCPSCKLQRSIDWSVRMVHESLMHKDNSFITLTYDNDHLPSDRLLCKRDVQLFIKRLRKAIYPANLRYFLCGEYGSKFKRPHYHIVFFGYKPDKLDTDLECKAGISQIFRSSFIESIWSKGHCYVGSVTQKSCAYVARYCTKKQDENFPHKEFTLCSTRPGIGSSYFDLHYKDFYKEDSVILITDDIDKPLKSFRVPKYYDKLLLKVDPFKYASIKERRSKFYENIDVNQQFNKISFQREKVNRVLDRLPRLLED
ncbi:replication initiator protein [Capybara microvirus Cap3_SP_535]|nr:replication initiator protein [Capybara microvirus Cap3_SP_535]